MIEMIGNFDVGHERPTVKQHVSTLATVSAIQQAFGLDPNAFAFHNELNHEKSCPGHTIDRRLTTSQCAQIAGAK
ncbi:hypothetical protein IMCC3135_33620 [Granulosicoccus antarcticus IMCC3135]|uniref:Uncharacterized protein n=1 Tax=Granulosicoccus antarcticus IMCC3135 TaxID=1192854 RepID=A0A2Z2P1P7_9GAMM|nr:hypothetical protein IMCC3135_33620 [Granulosicoccus antarcticus IMCC3135]